MLELQERTRKPPRARPLELSWKVAGTLLGLNTRVSSGERVRARTGIDAIERLRTRATPRLSPEVHMDEAEIRARPTGTHREASRFKRT
eukprot:15457146-Alexandrium_andersonii.AAC.1